jgi:hypothetical protein
MEEPLYLSILQQDYDGFITYLSERHISRVSEQYPLLLHAIIRWPEGVDTLLSRGFDTNNLDAHGYSALDLAIILEDVEAIDMLLQSDIHPTKYTWESSVLFFFRGNLQIRRTRLAQISQWLNRQALLDPGVNFISSDYISMVNKESPTPKMTTSSTKDVLYTLYHESGLDYLAARCLFEAGFRDIDVSATDGSYWAGTPLWTQACSMEIYNKEKVSLLAWLISKGANLQIEHWHLTAPVHAIFERIVGLRLSRFLGVPWNSFDEESVWRGDEFDDESVSDCDWEEYTLTDGAWMEEEIHNEKVPNGDFSGAEDYDVLVHAEGESERSEVRNDDGSEENGNQDDENVETSREDNIHDNGSYSAGREEDCRHSPENLECHDHKIPEVICMNDNRFEGNGNEPTPAPRSDNYSTRRVQHPFQVLVNQLWNSRTIDSCNCACSSHGCGIITSALKMTRHAFMDSIGAWRCTRDSRPPGDAQKKFFVIDYISRLSKYVDADIWVDDESCREALRVMTFDRLGLTHTCHNLGHSSVYCYPRNPLSQKEIEDIHYSEEKDLGLLEELVSEFESLWSQHPAGFTDFLRGRWTDRMDEVIAERSHPRDDEPGSVFRETGVILGPENLRDRRTRPKIGTLERFELDVWEIMNEVS